MKRVAQLVADTEMPDVQSFDLSLVAMADDELLEINRASLGHDWLTDVITFELERTPDAIEAEVYISVERALENARRYRTTLEPELLRLVIHAVLHLAGYGDKSVKDRKQMRNRERWYLVAI
jgi:probable rRNA maturation factor